MRRQSLIADPEAEQHFHERTAGEPHSRSLLIEDREALFGKAYVDPLPHAFRLIGIRALVARLAGPACFY